MTWELCHTRFSWDEVWNITRIITAWNSSPHTTSVQTVAVQKLFGTQIQLYIADSSAEQILFTIRSTENTDLVKHRGQAILIL